MVARRTLLLVGGAGRMGRRLGGFFRRRGFRVLVLDPAGPVHGYAAGRLEEASFADVVVVAAALPRVGEALDDVLSRKPRGLVFDVASVKAPVEKALRAAAKRGTAVASVHPMFGPSVPSFRGRDLIVCDVGD
ncbi:MAG TPA: prephenate dehydrogenase/arogenate dehydrogenase family protein, partial [Thermoanaerobaculia bacterium]|nr:prephenate dehydrogenase/arogenate dehydrogenase family protein [Thermoanaerobaculia bacterium]